MRSRPRSRQGSEPADALGAAGVYAETDKEPATGGKPGIIRRYASAIAIAVLFAAAGGAAAGIAVFRGPVSRPGLPSAAQDKAAANRIALRSRDFPLLARLRSRFLRRLLRVRLGVRHTGGPELLARHQPCVCHRPQGVSAAVTASAGATTAEVATQATSSDSLDGSWQAADVVAFHTSAAELRDDLAAMRSLLAIRGARACIDRYWSAAALARLPAGSQLSLSVSRPATPVLPGRPPVRHVHGGHGRPCAT